MSLSKLFQRIIWHNNTTPAINEDNLNAMSKAIDDIDDRVILIGDDVVTVIPQIQAYLEQAESIVEAVEELSQNPPYIGANGNWWVFDTTLEAYKDSGVDASITVDIADITMIAEGSQPYVTNTGTSTDPIFHLFLPRSPKGDTGNGIASIAKTGTQGLVDTYTITMTDGTTYTFTVTNGQGIGDMTKAVYDSTNAVADAGGITDYVEGKVAPMLNVLGAKNLLPYPYYETTKTINGVTFTDNKNGTITANGTATATLSFKFLRDVGKNLQWLNGKLLSGCSGGSTSTYFLRVTMKDTPYTSYARNFDGDTQISSVPNDNTVIDVDIVIINGASVDNVTFYPMIRPASIQDDTYVPYSMTNQQLTPYAQSQSNPNLLDNPWFTVNQRGESSYTTDGSKSIYTVDRFQMYKTSGLSLTVNNDGTITLANSGSVGNSFYQLVTKEEMSKLLGKTVTLSVLCSDGVLFTKTGTLPSTAPSSFTSVLTLYSDSSHPFTATITMGDGSDQNQLIRISMSSGKSCSFKAVKLELGSVSTLAMDTAPNYATELLKCQRYFYRMNTGGGIFQRIGIARASTATAVEPQVKLPTTMRSNPSVTVGGNITAFNIIGNGSSVAASSYSGTRFYGDYKKILFSAASNLVVNELYSIEVASTAETDTTYIDFSADL